MKSIISRATDGYSQSFRVDKKLTYAAGGKRYLNMDFCFTNQITIAEAHDPASEVEKEVKERFMDAVVTVHIEPICA